MHTSRTSHFHFFILFILFTHFITTSSLHPRKDVKHLPAIPRHQVLTMVNKQQKNMETVKGNSMHGPPKASMHGHQSLYPDSLHHPPRGYFVEDRKPLIEKSANVATAFEPRANPYQGQQTHNTAKVIIIDDSGDETEIEEWNSAPSAAVLQASSRLKSDATLPVVYPQNDASKSSIGSKKRERVEVNLIDDSGDDKEIRAWNSAPGSTVIGSKSDLKSDAAPKSTLNRKKRKVAPVLTFDDSGDESDPQDWDQFWGDFSVQRSKSLHEFDTALPAVEYGRGARLRVKNGYAEDSVPVKKFQAEKGVPVEDMKTEKTLPAEKVKIRKILTAKNVNSQKTILAMGSHAKKSLPAENFETQATPPAKIFQAGKTAPAEKFNTQKTLPAKEVKPKKIVPARPVLPKKVVAKKVQTAPPAKKKRQAGSHNKKSQDDPTLAAWAKLPEFIPDDGKYRNKFGRTEEETRQLKRDNQKRCRGRKSEDEKAEMNGKVKDWRDDKKEYTSAYDKWRHADKVSKYTPEDVEEARVMGREKWHEKSAKDIQNNPVKGVHSDPVTGQQLQKKCAVLNNLPPELKTNSPESGLHIIVCARKSWKAPNGEHIRLMAENEPILDKFIADFIKPLPVISRASVVWNGRSALNGLPFVGPEDEDEDLPMPDEEPEFWNDDNDQRFLSMFVGKPEGSTIVVYIRGIDGASVDVNSWIGLQIRYPKLNIVLAFTVAELYVRFRVPQEQDFFFRTDPYDERYYAFFSLSVLIGQFSTVNRLPKYAFVLSEWRIAAAWRKKLSAAYQSGREEKIREVMGDYVKQRFRPRNGLPRGVAQP